MSAETRKLDALTKPLGVIVVIGVLFLAFAPESIWHGGGVAPASERKATANFTLQDIDGKRWNLAEQRGRVVLVNYWATWCPPCRQETPGLVRLAIEYRGKGVEVAGISLDEDLTAVREFVAEYRISYPSIATNILITSLLTSGCAQSGPNIWHVMPRPVRPSRAGNVRAFRDRVSQRLSNQHRTPRLLQG